MAPRLPTSYLSGRVASSCYGIITRRYQRPRRYSIATMFVYVYDLAQEPGINTPRIIISVYFQMQQRAF